MATAALTPPSFSTTNEWREWRFEKLFGTLWRGSNLMVRIPDNKLIRCTRGHHRFYGFIRETPEGMMKFVPLIRGQKIVRKYFRKEQELVIERGPFKLSRNDQTDYFIGCLPLSNKGRGVERVLVSIETVKRLA
jgi:hypothetical protein